MIRIGVIGLGWWGKQIVTCLAESPRFKVVAGCDIDTKMAAPFAAAHKFDLVDDYKALLKRPDVDAVAVVTPHLLHEEMAIAAFGAGKQVFCEKPLALTTASAERILAACAKAGGVLGIGHERRYEPAMEEMRRLFESGALGRVLHMDANVSHNNFRKMDPSNWRRDPRHAPAGAWTALGIHLGDMFVSFAGRTRACERAHRFTDISGAFGGFCQRRRLISKMGPAVASPACRRRRFTVASRWSVTKAGSRCRKAATSTRASRRASSIAVPMAAARRAATSTPTPSG